MPAAQIVSARAAVTYCMSTATIRSASASAVEPGSAAVALPYPAMRPPP